MLSLGLDIGSSSIKAALLEIESGRVIAQDSYPEEELLIEAPYPGWAEQDPQVWWECVKKLIHRFTRLPNVNADRIACIGISYQMHGLVIIDDSQTVLRPSIIWCDSRAVETGDKALEALGEEYCLTHLLNWPGNFTASKFGWVKAHEPEIAKRVFKIMLPGDYIAMRLTGEITTTVSGLSEGVLWDFIKDSVSPRVMEHYGLRNDQLAKVVPTFSVQGTLTKKVATELGLKPTTVVSYRAGDQPNNALSLNVLEPGEIAATGGTSGVVYGITAERKPDQQSRVNIFAHVNHTVEHPRLGVLLCINGTGILNAWLRRNVSSGASYDEMNKEAGTVPIGSEGLSVLPFGNGAERVLRNENLQAHIIGLDFNRHTKAHLLRASQEGIAFSFRYGIDIMKELGLKVSVIRAGRENLFLSPLFRETLSAITDAEIELFETTGAQGAARGAAVGAGFIASLSDLSGLLTLSDRLSPDSSLRKPASEAYELWLERLTRTMVSSSKLTQAKL
jgi:xylulokinase